MPTRGRTGLIVGKFAPLHLGHQHLIETALTDPAIDELIVLVYANPDFAPLMPAHRRARWIRRLYPSAKVFVPENPPPDSADDFTQREFVRQWLERQGIRVERVYTSEAYGEGFARHIGAEPVLVDLPRKRFPISGTRLREWLAELEQSIKATASETGENPYAHASLMQWVHPLVYKDLLHGSQPVQKVVFLGAESTGKTTLTRRMAAEFQTEPVSEYGREHYEQKGGVMALEDYVHIARKHRELEDRAVQEARRGGRGYVFVDTNALTTLFFSYYYHQRALPELHKLADECQSRYHYVLVCADDIPFEQDGWRDNQTWRGRMQGLVLHDLDVRGTEYRVVHGTLEQRVTQVRAVLAGEPIPPWEAPLKQLGPRG